jgi:hypothetical protein
VASSRKTGLVGFGEVAKGRGRKPSISDEKVTEIVNLTLHSKPEGETHWLCRSMAKQVGGESGVGAADLVGART